MLASSEDKNFHKEIWRNTWGNMYFPSKEVVLFHIFTHMQGTKVAFGQCLASTLNTPLILACFSMLLGFTNLDPLPPQVLNNLLYCLLSPRQRLT